ncbi:MAG: DUF5929 domain-containing protein [Flavobacteriaceae bacterium]
MINKRLLIKALLAHSDENSFYDKKRKIDLSNKIGKAKFLKHICALSNSNPKNNAYIVLGIEDSTNEIVGVDFFDDSKLQNLVNAYLEGPPKVTYENIYFPNPPQRKVVGLVTIFPTPATTTLKKTIWKYPTGSLFLREGSISLPQTTHRLPKQSNASRVKQLETHARNSIKLTLDRVMDFIEQHKDPLVAEDLVFKEFFVVCWAGKEKRVKNRSYYSRVDIELINEQVKLFYSNLDEVEIAWTEDYFKITEYIQLGVEPPLRFYPLEEVKITFQDNGAYTLDAQLLFEPPAFDQKILHHRLNALKVVLDKLEKKQSLTAIEKTMLPKLAAQLMLCHLNGIPSAQQQLTRAKPLLKALGDSWFETYKESQRVLRKIKYQA